MDHPPRKAGFRLRPLATGGILLGAAGLYILLHVRAGYSFPTPWPDEAAFVWQAVAVCRSNSLLAPQLNAEQHVMWMPPGYALLLGLGFKLFGPSLEAARWLSAASALAALACFARAWQEYPLSTWLTVLTGLFWLDPRFVVAGNMARMEALVLFVVALAFALLARGRSWPAIALLGAAPLVHPNGLYFLIAGIACCALERRLGAGRRGPVSVADKAMLTAAAALWIAYGVYVACQWPAFAHGMGYQLARKTARGLAAELWSLSLLAAVLSWAGCAAYALRRGALSLARVAAFAAGAFLVNAIGHEMWYEVYDVLARLLLLALVLQTAAHLLTLPGNRWAPKRTVLLGMVCAGTLYAGPAFGWVGGTMEWGGMRMPSGERYLTDSERGAIRSALHAQPKRPLIVQVWPPADALFFAEENVSRILFVHEHVAFGRRAAPRPGVIVAHYSAANFPESWTKDSFDRALTLWQIDGMDPTQILIRRSAGEVWYWRSSGHESASEE